MEAQRFLPAAEFWVWSLSGPNVGQASAPLFRIHLACGVSTSFSQEHRPCSKLQRSSNPFGSILLLVKKKKAKTLKFSISLKWKLWFYCFFPLPSIGKCLISNFYHIAAATIWKSHHSRSHLSGPHSHRCSRTIGWTPRTRCWCTWTCCQDMQAEALWRHPKIVEI